MEKWIFKSFTDWWGFVRRTLFLMCKMVCRLLYAVIMGIVSVFVYVGKQIEAFCRRETIAAIIIGVVLCAMIVGWVFTFTKERTAYVTAQHKADSLAYSLDQFEQLYDSTATVVINGDTVRYGR